MEKLKEIDTPNLTNADGATLSQFENEKRGEILIHIQEKRQERDSKLATASSFKTKLKNLFGSTEGASLAHQARQIESDLRSHVSWKHRQLQNELKQQTNIAVQETIKNPLSEICNFYAEKSRMMRTAHNAGEPLDELSLKIVQEKAQQSLNQENVRLAFANRELRSSLTHDFDAFFDIQRNGAMLEQAPGFLTDVARSVLEGLHDAIKTTGIESIEDSPRLFAMLNDIARVYPEGFHGEEGKALTDLFLERGMLLELRSIAGLTELADIAKANGQGEQFDALLTTKLNRACEEKEWDELQSACTSYSKHIAEPAKKRLGEELEQYGITFSDIENAWDIFPASGMSASSNISRNFEKMETLEQQRPGIVHSLFSEFGIKEFRRYPIDALITQYDDRDKNEPYGVVLFSNMDHNQSFDMRAHVIEGIFKQTGEHGIGMRIAEFDSRYEIMKRLASLNSKYGEQHKISYLFLGAHGDEDSFATSYSHSDEVHKRDFNNSGTARLRDFFVEHPEIVLASCSTGAKNGIGQKISETFGATVHAPDKPTSVKSINVTFTEDNKPHFTVTYLDDVLRTYDMGIQK